MEYEKNFVTNPTKIVKDETSSQLKIYSGDYFKEDIICKYIINNNDK